MCFFCEKNIRIVCSRIVKHTDNLCTKHGHVQKPRVVGGRTSASSSPSLVTSHSNNSVT